MKEWYREARTYLHIDDAIRIQGYLNTLESLGIAFIAVRLQLPVVTTTLMSKSAVCLVQQHTVYPPVGSWCMLDVTTAGKANLCVTSCHTGISYR